MLIYLLLSDAFYFRNWLLSAVTDFIRIQGWFALKLSVGLFGHFHSHPSFYCRKDFCSVYWVILLTWFFADKLEFFVLRYKKIHILVKCLCSDVGIFVLNSVGNFGKQLVLMTVFVKFWHSFFAEIQNQEYQYAIRGLPEFLVFLFFWMFILIGFECAECISTLWQDLNGDNFIYNSDMYLLVLDYLVLSFCFV